MEVQLKKKMEVFKQEFPSIFRSKTAADCDWLPAFYLRAFYYKDEFKLVPRRMRFVAKHTMVALMLFLQIQISLKMKL